MITVTVTLYPPLRDQLFAKADVEVASPASVATLLDHLDIKAEKVESIYVNSRETGFNHPLSDGDRVSLLPMIGGG